MLSWHQNVQVVQGFGEGGRGTSYLLWGAVRQGEGGYASSLPWAGVQPAERAAWVQAAISQTVSAVLGRPVGPEEPLMSAGLDSLGAHHPLFTFLSPTKVMDHPTYYADRFPPLSARVFLQSRKHKSAPRDKLESCVNVVVCLSYAGQNAQNTLLNTQPLP